jgi:hypothetical protein
VSEDKKPLSSAGALRRFKDKKPRRARALILLALSAALAFLLFALIRPQAAPQSEEAERTPFVLIDRDRTLLRSITVAMAGSDPYTLINQNDYDLSDKNDVLGEEYALEGNPDFAVSTVQVLSMERYASDLTVEEMAAREPADLDQYGLKQPSMTVTIGYRDGVREALRFGGLVPTGGSYYLQRVGDAAVYVAGESIYEAFHRPLSELEQTAEEKANLEAARKAEAADQQEAGATVQPGGAEDNPDAAEQPEAGAAIRPGDAEGGPDEAETTASPEDAEAAQTSAPETTAQPGAADAAQTNAPETAARPGAADATARP